MASDEEVALRDLVSQTLDAKGILPKIRAELRANMFLALDETQKLKEIKNNDLSAFAKTAEGALVLNLVRDFLEFYHLDFTLSVFEPESRLNLDYEKADRRELASKTNVTNENQKKVPLLCQLLDLKARNNAAVKEVTPQPSPGLNSTYTKGNLTPARNGEDVDDEVSLSTQSVSEEASSRSGGITPTNENPDESLNLLMFTPVQKVQTTPKVKEDEKKDMANGSLKDAKSLNEKKTTNASNPSKETKSAFSQEVTGSKNVSMSSAGLLKDLPPLSGTARPMGNSKDISSIKKLLESTEASSSDSSEKEKFRVSSGRKAESKGKQETAVDSDGTIPDDDDISQLLNSHNSSDSQVTADETTTRLSDRSDLDHIESV